MSRSPFPALLCTAALCAAGGCAGHQSRDITLDVPLPENYAGAVPSAGKGDDMGRWWKAFDDHRLDAMVTEVLGANLDLREAYARLDGVRALVGIAAAERRPFVTATFRTGPEHLPGATEGHTGAGYRLALEAGYEVDLWQKLRAREDAARFDESAVQADIETLYLSLAARTVDLYYLVAEQRAQIRHIEETVASFAETLDRVEGRYRMGLVPALDIYQARQNLSQARSRKPPHEAALAKAQNALALLMGRYPGGESFGEVAQLPGALQAWPEGLPSELLNRRPDIKAAHLRLRASDARVAAAVAERFPAFNILAGFGQSRTSLAAGTVTGLFWNFLLGLSQPLLDGGRRQSGVDRAEALFQENLARYQKTVLRAFQDVEDALAVNAATEARLVHLEDRVGATEEALRLSTERYLQGLSSYLPVLTAQILNFDARSLLLAARRQLVSDRVSLALALGGSWMGEERSGREGDGTIPANDSAKAGERAD